jgi:hypothetical protein
MRRKMRKTGKIPKEREERGNIHGKTKLKG